MSTDSVLPTDHPRPWDPSHATVGIISHQKLVKTHRVNYLQVYDMHGKLVEPSRYCWHLQGALVQVHFTLTHWSIAAKTKNGLIMPACDTFSADIYSMRVLSPPKKYGPVTPRKCKFVNSDPMTPDMTPKKFRNFTKEVMLLCFPFQYLLCIQWTPTAIIKTSKPDILSYFPIYTTLYSQ